MPLTPGDLPPHGASALPACLKVLLVHAVALLNSHVGSFEMQLIESVVTTENSDELSENASEGQNKGCIEASCQEEAPLDMSLTVMATTTSPVVTLSALASTIPVLAFNELTSLTLLAALLSFAHSMSIFTISSKVTASLALINLKNLGETHLLHLA